MPLGYQTKLIEHSISGVQQELYAADAAQYLNHPWFGQYYFEVGAVTSEFRTSAFDLTDLTTYTFAAQSIGTASATRRVVVGVGWASAAATTVSSLTIGGITATADGDSGAATGNRRAMIFSAIVPTGTTADVVVTLSGTGARLGIGVWRLSGGGPTGATSASVNAGSGTLTVTTVADDIVFAYGFSGNSSATPATATWTGASERFDDGLNEASNSNSSSGSDATASGSSTAIDFSTTGATWRAFVAAGYR